MDNVQSTMNELVGTVNKFMSLIEMIRTIQKEYNICCITRDLNSNNNSNKMNLAAFYLFQSICNEISTDDSESNFSNLLHEYIQILKNSLT